MKRLAALKCALAAVTALGLAGCAGRGEEAAFPDLARTVFGDYLAGRYAERIGDDRISAAYFARALSQSPEETILRESAFISALEAGDMEPAAEFARQTLENDPSDRLARITLAVSAIADRDYDAALARLEGAELGPFNRVIGALLRAWAHAGKGDQEAAFAALAFASTADEQAFGDLADAHKALLLDYFGDEDAAEAAFEAVAGRGLVSGSAAEAHGRLLERQGRTEDAIAVYQTQIDRVGRNILLEAAIERARAGREKPKPFIRRPGDGAAEALFGPAAALAAQRQRELAIIYLRLALTARPDHAPALALLAALYERSGRTEAAVTLYDAVDPRSPTYVGAQIDRAWALWRDDQETVALASARALARETDDPRARSTLADMLRAQGLFEEAVEVLDGLIADLDDAVEWSHFFARGAARERLGRWDGPEGAQADLERALELSPDQPDVLNYLGYSWVDRGERLDEGFELIKRAVELRPNSGYIVDSLGWAYYRLGDYDTAVEHLERAVELDPQDPTLNDHLGDAYWQVGRRLEARFQWRRALSLEPEAEEIPVLQAKVQVGLSGTTPPGGDAEP
ncbi:MAG: tetratricopeptide repeat protein [Maricaulaceae bacterium]